IFLHNRILWFIFGTSLHLPHLVTWGATSKYFYPKSTPENPRWFMVDVKWKAAFKRPVSLREIKGMPDLQNMYLVRRARLSVQQVEKAEFERVREVGMR
ncbi:MAG: EVE domain-containing protein, partial [bacterium]